MTNEMWSGLRDVFLEMKNRDDVKVIVLTGKGEAFCTGSDVEKRLLARVVDGKFVALEKTRAEVLEPVIMNVPPAVYNVGKPTIAAVNGVAAGAGLSLSLLCDFRIASEKARFIPSWLNVALTPDIGATFTMPRIIGIDKTLQLLYERKPLDARQAERIGLVTGVVPHEELRARVAEFAGNIAAGPSVALELAKRAVSRSLESDLVTQLYFENYAQNICFQSADFREGVNAFREKRKPRFQGE
jgi:2-(1,2-epoxy-1,2-dihydrophenyl)acetyl-CoA isomerase